MENKKEPMLILYRGDSLPLRDGEAQGCVRAILKHFCALRARSFCGRLRADRLIDQVLAHIGHEPGSPEEQLAKDSPFISFSRCLRSAFSFMEGTRQQDLKECQWLHEATFFVWELRLDRSDLHRMPCAGWYWFSYKPDFGHVHQHLVRWVKEEYAQEARTGDYHGLASALGETVAAARTESTASEHHAIIINACKYIEHNCRGRRLYQRALDAARRDQEWLLYPYDFGEDTRPTGEFLVNRHLIPVALYRGAIRDSHQV